MARVIRMQSLGAVVLIFVPPTAPREATLKGEFSAISWWRSQAASLAVPRGAVRCACAEEAHMARVIRMQSRGTAVLIFVPPTARREA